MTARRSRGLGLIGAIFLITVVAFLAVAITRSINTSAASHALEITSAQALLAAESGAQLAVRRIYPATGAGTCGDVTWSLESIGLRGCQASTACRVEVVGGLSYHTIESSGRCTDGGVVTAERIVLVRTQS